VELAEKERFSDSRPGRVRPFRMYKDNRMITAKLTYLEEGWNFHNTDDAQVNCNFYSKNWSVLRLTDGRYRYFENFLAPNKSKAHL